VYLEDAAYNGTVRQHVKVVVFPFAWERTAPMEKDYLILKRASASRQRPKARLGCGRWHSAIMRIAHRLMATPPLARPPWLHSLRAGGGS